MKNILEYLQNNISECEYNLENMETPSNESTPEYEQGYKDGLSYAQKLITQSDFKDLIIDTIRGFVGKNYGDSELSTPSWDIDALADAINNEIKGRDA